MKNNLRQKNDFLKQAPLQETEVTARSISSVGPFLDADGTITHINESVKIDEGLQRYMRPHESFGQMQCYLLSLQNSLNLDSL